MTTLLSIVSALASINFQPFVKHAQESSIEPVIETPALT